MCFISEYLRSAGMGGWPFLRELNLEWNDVDDVLCLADALLHGGGKGSAPNLERITFRGDEYLVNIARLGQLFARGALATIKTLEFDGMSFKGEDMTNLMSGFEQSGHQGYTIRKLVFKPCTMAYNGNEPVLDHVEEASLALIAGLRAGIFPNLQELLIYDDLLMVREVPELVEEMLIC